VLRPARSISSALCTRGQGWNAAGVTDSNTENTEEAQRTQIAQ
jgi:hypothetical protein